MRSQRTGHIISIASICGVIGFDMASIYCATKFALAGWSESLSLELRRFGIHATVVYPGAFRTDFLDRTSVAHGDLKVDDYDEITAAAASNRDRANHQQAGDAAAFGQAMVRLASLKEPPSTFAAGSDAVEVMSGRARVPSG
jgi:short-subunit dehydrogenase